MPYTNQTNIYSNSRYIVSTSPGSPYTTVQSAINAANAAGGNATIWVRAGTYTENLTLYDTVDIEGADSALSIIVGTHTPPNSGAISFTRIGLNSGTDVLSSAAAGSTVITFSRCVFNLTNGYACNLTNWTGAMRFRYCIDNSTKNGIVYNTAGASVLINHGILGLGANVMTCNGNVSMFSVNTSCPILLNGTGVSEFVGACNFQNNITTANTHNLKIAQCRISSGATQAITHNSATQLVLDSVIVNTSNATAIGGTGTIKQLSVEYPNSNVIAGTITTTLDGVTRTAEMWADNITRMKDSGFYSWAAGAPYFDDTTLGTFDLLVGGTGYIQDKRITWSAQNITGMTAGNTYWIYIDSTGTIGKTSSRTDALFQDNIVLFQCLRDSTSGTNIQYTVKENHGYDFQPGPSNYLHDVVGSVIENNNNGANITLNGTVKIQINGQDYLNDHGLETTIPDSGGTAVSWNKMFTNAGGKWCRQNATDTFAGYYNSGGTPTALGGSKFGVYTLYVSKDNLNSATPVYFAVLDTSQYNTSGAASTAIANGTTAKASAELAALELCQLGYIIFSQASGTIVSVIIAKTTLRSTTSTSGTNTASLVNTSTTNFDGILSATDTNVQTALETIDEFGKNLTDHCVVVGNGNGLPLGVIGAGATGTTLIGVTGADPTFGTAVVAGGGTGAVTLTSHGVLLGNGTSAVQITAEPSDGQLLIGKTGDFPQLATITAGAGISITNAAGAITIASTAGGMAYEDVTTATKTIVNNTSYGANRGAGVAFTLPASAAAGTVFEILGILGNWSIVQGANQYIRYGDLVTTVGAGGSITATSVGDCMTCRCIEADRGWIAYGNQGAPTIV